MVSGKHVTTDLLEIIRAVRYEPVLSMNMILCIANGASMIRVVVLRPRHVLYTKSISYQNDIRRKSISISFHWIHVETYSTYFSTQIEVRNFVRFFTTNELRVFLQYYSNIELIFFDWQNRSVFEMRNLLRHPYIKYLVNYPLIVGLLYDPIYF